MAHETPNIGYIRQEVANEFSKWALVEDCANGEEAVKAAGDKYLPKPESDNDTTRNENHYVKYKTRAVFFPALTRTLEGLIGQVFSKPVKLETPSTLETLQKDIDGVGTTAEQQMKQTLGNVLKHGRAGLLSDFPKVEGDKIVTRADIESGKIRPRVILYNASQIINWRETTNGGQTELSLLVLVENQIVNDDGYEFETRKRWRVYRLEEGKVVVGVWKQKDEDNPKAGTEIEYEIAEDEIFVMGKNDLPLERIPFCFIGSENNDSTVDKSPSYPIAGLNVAHYRNSADYEQMVFITGQATPVFTGLDNDWVKDHIKGKVHLGSSNAVSLPPNATASLLQATPNSTPMEAMKHKEDLMKYIGAKLIEVSQVQKTAFEVGTEETSEASVLSSVAENVSAAYKKAFYYCSLFMGEDVAEDAIIVELNTEFQVAALNAQERQEVVAAWQGGLLTREEVRNVYRRKGIATTPDEEAFVKIKAEQEDSIPSFNQSQE